MLEFVIFHIIHSLNLEIFSYSVVDSSLVCASRLSFGTSLYRSCGMFDNFPQPLLGNEMMVNFVEEIIQENHWFGFIRIYSMKNL